MVKVTRYCSFLLFSVLTLSVWSQVKPTIEYKITLPDPASHRYHVELQTKGWNQDSLVLKMPKWTPGYYQIMNYAKAVENLTVRDTKGENVSYEKRSENQIVLKNIRNRSLQIAYEIMTSRKFVASCYVDAEHAYLTPAGTFFYPDGFLQLPVTVEIIPIPWKHIATGLEPLPGKPNHFHAPDFDILYDCPILIGNLEELPSFTVNNVPHRFIGYNLGTFDKQQFIDKLAKITKTAVDIIGDIPYKQYTYIAIGPGRGGIEHLNNTTVSFDGAELSTPDGMNRMMNFLAHEYFHHFNVKRIRPFELGPFDYDKGSRTNLLWVSEGLTVYYEYLMVKRAGLVDEQTLFSFLEGNINNHENNPGKVHQSLTQSSYNTWKDGPFGTQGEEPGKTISYYEKGPIVGLLLDFHIRHATQNKKSLDDVMRLLYWRYYKEKQRGFTDAEFEQTCEEVADVPLGKFFEFVYTTHELDYTQYLGFAGLTLEETTVNQKRKLILKRVAQPNAKQTEILNAWLGEK